MFDIWFGAALIVIGLVSLLRARVGEKAAGIMTLTHPQGGLMSRRERGFALVIGSANVVLGVVALWVGLRHR